MGFLKMDYQPSSAGLSSKEASDPDTFGVLQEAAGGVKPIGDAPDMTDKLVRQRRAAAAFSALSGRGRSATMLTTGAGPQVGSSGLGKTLLGGG